MSEEDGGDAGERFLNDREEEGGLRGCGGVADTGGFEDGAGREEAGDGAGVGLEGVLVPVLIVSPCRSSMVVAARQNLRRSDTYHQSAIAAACFSCSSL